MGKIIKIGDTQTEVRITHMKKSLYYFIKTIMPNKEYGPHLDLLTMMTADMPTWVKNSDFRYVRPSFYRSGIIWQGKNDMGNDWKNLKPN